MKDFGTAEFRTNRLTVEPWESLSVVNVRDEDVDTIVFNCPEAVNLYKLNIKESQLREVVLQHLPGLTELDAVNWTNYTTYEGARNLEKIDFLDVPNLETVDLRNAASLVNIDLTRCPNVSSLKVSHSSTIESINVSGLTQLTTLTLGYWYNYANYYGLRGLEVVNVDGCTGLTYFEIGDVTTTGMELDLTGAPNIETVRMWRWYGRSLDVSANTNLKYMYLHRFHNYANCETLPYIEEIDMTGCTGLLDFQLRKLGGSSSLNLSLDFTSATSIQNVNVWTPNVTSIDLSNTAVQTLDLSYFYNYGKSNRKY